MLSSRGILLKWFGLKQGLRVKCVGQYIIVYALVLCCCVCLCDGEIRGNGLPASVSFIVLRRSPPVCCPLCAPRGARRPLSGVSWVFPGVERGRSVGDKRGSGSSLLGQSDRRTARGEWRGTGGDGGR